MIRSQGHRRTPMDSVTSDEYHVGRWASHDRVLGDQDAISGWWLGQVTVTWAEYELYERDAGDKDASAATLAGWLAREMLPWRRLYRASPPPRPRTPVVRVRPHICYWYTCVRRGGGGGGSVPRWRWNRFRRFVTSYFWLSGVSTGVVKNQLEMGTVVWNQ